MKNSSARCRRHARDPARCFHSADIRLYLEFPVFEVQIFIQIKPDVTRADKQIYRISKTLLFSRDTEYSIETEQCRAITPYQSVNTVDMARN